MTTQTTTNLTLADLTGDYVIDPSHSRIGFQARHMMVAKVRGQFNSFEGILRLNADDPTDSYGKVTIKAGSVDTASGPRDEHLRSGDFLGDSEHPDITFATTRIEADGEDFKVVGDLTIREVTKPVTFNVEMVGYGLDAYGNTRVGFEGATKIDRHDWGVSWNAAIETGGVVVSDKVVLEFEISAIKQ